MRKIFLNVFPLLILLFITKQSIAQARVKVTAIGSPTSKCTESTTEPIAFFLFNNGTTNLSNIAFNLSFTKNGGPPATESFTFPSFAIGATVGNTFLTHFLDLSAPGTYTIKVYSSLSTGTTDTLTTTVTNGASVAGTLRTMNGTGEDSLCDGLTYNHLTLSGYTAPVTNIKGWQSSNTGAPGSWMNLGNANSATYTTGILNSTTYFRVVVRNTVPAPPCDTAYSSIDTLIVYPIPHLNPTFTPPPYTVYTGACSNHPFSITISSNAPNSTYAWKKVRTTADTTWANWTRIASDIGAHYGTGPTINNTFIASDSVDARPNAYYRFIITAHGCTTPGVGDLLQIRLDSLSPVAAGVIAGATPVCMSTSHIYNVGAIVHAAWYNWVYTGLNVTCQDFPWPASCSDNSNTWLFAPANPGTPFPFTNLATSGNMTVNGGNWCSAYYGNGATSSKAIIVDTAALVHVGGPDYMCKPKPIVLSGAHVGGSVTTGKWTIISLSGKPAPPAPPAIPNPLTYGVLSLFNTLTSQPDTVHYAPPAGYAGTVTLRLTTATPPVYPDILCGFTSEDRIITVDFPASAHAGGPTTICQKASKDSIYLTGAGIDGPIQPFPGTKVQWHVMTVGAGTLSWADADTTKPDSIKFFPTPNYAGTVSLRLITNNPKGLPCVPDTVFRTIIIDSLAIAVAGARDTVCKSSLATKDTLRGAYVKGGANQGKWQKVGGAGGTLSSTAFQNNTGIAATTYTLLPNFVGTDTLRLISNDITVTSGMPFWPTATCHIDTAYRYVTASPPPLGGTVGNEAIVCSGINGDTLTVSGYTPGASVKNWQYSIDGGISWKDTANNTNNPARHAYKNISTTTWYRAVVAFKSCTAFSIEARITVDAHPLSVGGTASRSKTVCSGSNLDTLKLTGNIGKIIRWEYTTDNGNTWVYVNDTTHSLIYKNLTVTTIYRAVSLNSACGSANSSKDTITVDPLPIAIAGGSATICSNDSVTVSGASASNGTILWTKNLAAAGTLTGATTLTPKYVAAAGDIGNTVTLTLKVKSLNTNACFPDSALATFTIKVVNVNPIPTASAGKCDTICQTGTAVFTGVATNGTIVWTHNGMGGITAGQGTASPSYTAAAGDAGHTVILKMTVTSNACLPAISATAFDTVKVDLLPTAIAGGSQTLCSNGTTAIVSGASATNGTILWTHNGTGTLSAATTLTPTYNIAAGDAGKTVTLTMTVTSNNKCTPNTATATYSIILTDLPTASAGGSTTMCSNGSVTIGGTSATGGTILWTHDGLGSIAGATTLTPTYTAVAGDAGLVVTLTMSVTSTNACAPLKATAFYTVNVRPMPTATAGGNQTICQTGTAIVSGASSSNGTISWTHNGLGAITLGQGTLTPTYTAATGDAGHTVILTMTVTSPSCLPAVTAIAIYTVNVNALPTATTGGGQSICQTGTAIVSGAAAANGTILWFHNGAGSLTNASTLTPTYTAAAGDAGHAVVLTMTVTSINSCAPATASATYIVNVDPLTVGGVLSGTAMGCSGANSGALTLSGETGNVSKWQSSTNAGATWTDIANTTGSQVYTNLIDTTWYRVVVASGSCGNANSLVGIITVVPPTVGGTVSLSDTVCAGSNAGTLTLTGYTGTVQNWQSSVDNGTTWLTIANTTASQGYHNLVVTTKYRAYVKSGVCNADTSVAARITVDSVSHAGTISGSFPGCAYANSGTLTLAGYIGAIHWQFSTNNGTTWTDTTGTGPTQVYSNLPDTILYRAIVRIGTCSADTSAATKVIVYPKPNAVFKADTVCFGGVTAFINTSTVAAGFIQFNQWDFGDNNSSLSVNPTHTYSPAGIYNVHLVTTSNYGCLDTAIHPVLVHPLPSATITHIGPLSFCCGDSVTLSAIAGMNYVWTPYDTLQTIKVKNCSAGGPYQVSVTDPATLCTNSSSVSVVIFPLPIANAGKDTTLFLGSSFTLHGQGGIIYSWSPITGLSNPAIASPVATPLVTTTEELTVTDINGCSDKDTMTMTVIVDYNVIVTNVLTTNGDGYNDKWIVKNIENYPGTGVIIVNREGQQVFESSAYDNTWDGTNKGKALPDGTYYYFIKFNNSDKIFKGPITILNEKK